MDTKTAQLDYEQIDDALRAFDAIIGWVRDADLTFDLNYNRSMHQTRKDQIEDTRDEINDRYQLTLDDDTPIYRTPSGQLVAPVEGRFELVERVDHVNEQPSFTPTGEPFITEEEQSEIVQKTPQGVITKADVKQSQLDIAASDPSVRRQEMKDLDDRLFKVPYVPVSPSAVRDPERVNADSGVDFSALMHIFEGIDHPAKIDDGTESTNETDE